VTIEEMNAAIGEHLAAKHKLHDRD
jgi:hypothetical protein